MDKEYLHILKTTTDMRPKKPRIKEHKEEVLLEQDKGMNDVHAEIIKWFMENPSPPDTKVHALADKLGMKPDILEGHIYMILSSILSGGKSKDFKGTYNPEQIKMGIKVETEHTNNPLIAEKIAKDHLSEIPDYYTRLDKMEKSAGINESVLHEIFIQAGEIEKMDSGVEKDKAMLRLSMEAELDAVNLYERFSTITDDEQIKEVMLDVSNEEKVHVGEFQSLLEEIDEDYEDKVDEGEGEVDKITS